MKILKYIKPIFFLAFLSLSISSSADIWLNEKNMNNAEIDVYDDRVEVRCRYGGTQYAGHNYSNTFYEWGDKTFHIQRIAIEPGKSGYVRNHSRYTITFVGDQTGDGKTRSMFINRSYLEIKSDWVDGVGKRRIRLDGGAQWNYNDQACNFREALIKSRGDLYLEGVVLCNFSALRYDPNNSQNEMVSGAIKMNTGGTGDYPTDAELGTGYLHLYDCEIAYCASIKGAAINVGPTGYNNDWDRWYEYDWIQQYTYNKRVWIENCDIHHNKCIDGDTDNNWERWGGAVRFNGACCNSLWLKHSNFYSNVAQNCSAGALLWNANGDCRGTPTCYIDDCKFYENWSDGSAGALRLESETVFENANSYIYSNTAVTNGGGVELVDYQADAGYRNKRDITYRFSEYAKIYWNLARRSGGGIYMGIRGNVNNNVSIWNPITISLNLDGAEIYQNRGRKDGGGICLEGAWVDSSTGWNLKVNLNSGSIWGNRASRGGGIYTYRYTVDCADNGQPVYINGNHGHGPGAGMYMEKGTVTLRNLYINDNTMWENGADDVPLAGDWQDVNYDGAGVFILDGNFYAYNGEIMRNRNRKAWGGGLMVEGREFVPECHLTNFKIKDNWASNGAGVLVRSAKMRIYSGTEINDNGHDYEGFGRCSHGGGMMIQYSNSDVIMYGGQINSNWAVEGGGVWLDDAKFTLQGNGEDGCIRWNHATGPGGGVHAWNWNSAMYLNGGMIDGNSSDGNGGGAFLNRGRLEINGGGELRWNSSANWGGGAYLIGDATYVQTGGSIWHNYAQWGGGMFVDQGYVNISGGSFSENGANRQGGAIYKWGHDKTVDLSNCSFSNNYASTEDGGAVAITDGYLNIKNNVTFSGNYANHRGGAIFGENAQNIDIRGTINFDGNTVEVNGDDYTQHGGAIMLTNSSLSMDGATFNNNRSGNFGGAISLLGNANATLGSSTFTNNRAEGNDGGAIYCENSTMTLAGGWFEKNYALYLGGAVMKRGGGSLKMTNSPTFCNNDANQGGGLFVDNAGVEVGGAEFYSNNARESGGAVYLNNSWVNLENGKVHDNTANWFGGGIHFSGDNNYEVTLTNSSIYNNKAAMGGGIGLNGYMTANINGCNIEGNEATRAGGGIYSRGYNNDRRGVINYSNGLVRNNRATGSKNTTTYNLSPADDNAHGYGGGIYVDWSGSLYLNNANTLGLYNNLATMGGDDIGTFGWNTIVKFPDVSHMNLEGYSYDSTRSIYWVEDFNPADGEYWRWSDHDNRGRYREVSSHLGLHEIPAGEYVERYILATIGWSRNTITIAKWGMADNENAIFDVYRIRDGKEELLFTVNLAKEDAAGDHREKTIIVQPNDVYRVVETSWAWTYDTRILSANGEQGRTIERWISTDSSLDDRTFRFFNTKKPDMPMHDEGYIRNVMRR